LRKITSPTFILGTKEENIAPSKSAYRATQFYGGPVKFVLSASGHMAGVISAPGSKYGHWTNSSNPSTADEWVQNRDRVSEFVVASLERVGDDLLRWTSRGPDARRGLSVIENAPGS
jgi:polyhydroxyalkanoate synthase